MKKTPIIDINGNTKKEAYLKMHDGTGRYLPVIIIKRKNNKILVTHPAESINTPFFNLRNAETLLVDKKDVITEKEMEDIRKDRRLYETLMGADRYRKV